MYYVMHFYIDKTPDLTDTSNILRMTDVFQSEFGMTFDYINYSVLNPDGNGFLHDDRYELSGAGIVKFRNIVIEPQIIGKYGDISNPIISISQDYKSDEFFRDNYIMCLYPANDRLMGIYVYIKKNKSTTISFLCYSNVIEKLENIGYRVNNSFVELYYWKRACNSLLGDCSNMISTYYARKFREQRGRHQRCGYRNHVFDIFAVNSILKELLDDNKLKQIEHIVGSDHIKTAGSSVIFEIPDLASQTPLYRCRKKKMIRELHTILQDLLR